MGSRPRRAQECEQKNPNNYQYTQEIKTLAYRFALLALREHQFGPARNEAMARYAIRHDREHNNNRIDILVDTASGDSTSSLDQHNVGVFDYECDTGTKLSRNEWNHANGKGFGATSNTQGIDQIHLGITTGRVDLFMTKRYDIQCCFFPRVHAF